MVDAKFRAHMTECLREYFGTANEPVTLMRAETDLLVRVLTNQYAMLAAHAASVEKRQEAKGKKGVVEILDSMEITQAGTDLALITSICGKLRESEKNTRG